jgi:ferredoxin
MNSAYYALAKHLDSYPHGFPATKSGIELKLLAYLFTPEEAQLALSMNLQYRPLTEISIRSGISRHACQTLVLNMAKKGLVNLRSGPDGPELSLPPFIVGFYENQVLTMDETFAQLFEQYYQEALYEITAEQPQFHRIVPVNVSINSGVEILPEENVASLLSQKQAWAVLDCICRKQQALIGQGCDHPVRVCLAMSDTPGIFEGIPDMEALDLDGALQVLDQAAKSGLVHTVSNQKRDIGYICSCCTCSCGLLRGIADAHMANIVAKSSYFAVVDESLCVGCEDCEAYCQFDAIKVEETATINKNSCVGCGVCVRICPEGAITLMKRPAKEVKQIPESVDEWLVLRRQARKKA